MVASVSTVKLKMCMEKSPSWSRAHDWKSCKPQKGFESSNLSFSAIFSIRRFC